MATHVVVDSDDFETPGCEESARAATYQSSRAGYHGYAHLSFLEAPSWTLILRPIGSGEVLLEHVALLFEPMEDVTQGLVD